METTGRLTRQLDSLMTIGTTGGLTDGQLLERFIIRDSETAEQAFAALVERHGPLVMRVCRSVLTDPHDAEDAFQATFLVLVRKARVLWVEDSLGPWLHQVAVRTTRRARAAVLRRRKHETSAARPASQATSTDHDDDLDQALHAEIDRLPERFRVPVVLCDLQGSSHEQAARHLGWPVGTVKSRLSRARERLRHRLLRRGFAPGAIVADFSRSAARHSLLPGDLLRSTSTAAAEFLARRTITNSSAALLANGVLSAMTMTHWWKLASLLTVAAVTVSGTGLIAGGRTQTVESRPQRTAEPAVDQPDHVVIATAAAKTGTFEILVPASGQLEPTHREEVVNRVQGQSTIISLLPEGTRVKQGDVVVELDSGTLRDQHTNQVAAARSAEAAFLNARLTREAAEIAIKEYAEGVSLMEHAALRGQIKIAESEFSKAESRLQRTRRVREQLDGVLARNPAARTAAEILADQEINNQLDSADLDVQRGKLAHEQAQSRLMLLENYTRAKRTKELTSEREKALVDELAARDRFRLESDRVTHLEKQIASCRLIAPCAGVIQYANDPRRRASGSPTIEEGATVRERQILVWIVDLDGSMQVNAKVPEGGIKQVRNGQNARVAIDAFPGETFTGLVTVVAPIPDSSTPGSSKLFTTTVQLAEKSPRLRPSLTARADIVVEERADVLMVPSQALIQARGKTQVAVQKPKGGFELRDVVVGQATGSDVEIKQGLKAGEQVAIDIPALFRRGLKPAEPGKAP